MKLVAQHGQRSGGGPFKAGRADVDTLHPPPVSKFQNERLSESAAIVAWSLVLISHDGFLSLNVSLDTHTRCTHIVRMASETSEKTVRRLHTTLSPRHADILDTLSRERVESRRQVLERALELLAAVTSGGAAIVARGLDGAPTLTEITT